MAFSKSQLWQDVLPLGMERVSMKSVIEDWDDCLWQLDKAAENLQKVSEAIERAKNALKKFNEVSEDKKC